MKKNAAPIFLVLLVVLGFQAHAQWNTSSTTPNYSMGKVAIGFSTAPTYDFTVYNSSSPYVAIINSTYTNNDPNFVRKGGIIFQQQYSDKTAAIQMAVPTGYHVPGILFSTKTAYNLPSSSPTDWYDRMFIHPNGFIGIGTTAPTRLLHLQGSAGADIRMQSSTAAWEIQSDAFGAGNFGIIDYSGGSASTTKCFVMSKTTGNVAIGTNDAKGYKLAVGGKIIGEEVIVKLQANWPDYVFEPSYKLVDINELSRFVKANHHLPEVPSADDVKNNGIAVGEMERILLKKVEELTLYLIEQDAKIKSLEKAITELRQ